MFYIYLFINFVWTCNTFQNNFDCPEIDNSVNMRMYIILFEQTDLINCYITIFFIAKQIALNESWNPILYTINHFIVNEFIELQP